MIEDFILWLKTPLGEEVFIMFLLPLISSVLILWGISKLFKFKRNSFLTALCIGFLYTVIEFFNRLTSILLKLSDQQKPPINITAAIISNILLLILIILIYKESWRKTILSWLFVYFGKFTFVGIIMLIMMFYFPILSEDDPSPTVKAGISDFYINNISEVGNQIGNNQFEIYKSKIETPISIRVVNLLLDIAFNSRTEGITMDLECMTPEEILFSSIQNKEIDELEAGKQYMFGISDDKLDSYFRERNISFSFYGFAHLSCEPNVCNEEKTIFNFKNIFQESKNFTSRETIAKMDNGKFFGTKMLYIERRKPMMANIDFVFGGNKNKTISCNAYIITEKPSNRVKKSFMIKYIAD